MYTYTVVDLDATKPSSGLLCRAHCFPLYAGTVTESAVTAQDSGSPLHSIAHEYLNDGLFITSQGYSSGIIWGTGLLCKKPMRFKQLGPACGNQSEMEGTNNKSKLTIGSHTETMPAVPRLHAHASKYRQPSPHE